MKMENKIERPEIVKEKHLTYLDMLRESGVTNMYGAGIYLEKKFKVSRDNANKILRYWMNTFSERHAKSI